MAPLYTAAMPQPQPYQFGTHIGATCARQFISFQDLADKLKMDVHQLMKGCNGHAPPSRALVKRAGQGAEDRRVGFLRSWRTR